MQDRGPNELALVVDSRQLVFDIKALRASLRCDSRVAQYLRIPVGEDDTLELLANEQCMEITQAAAEGDAPTIHRLNASQVAALLIAYCIRTGIPVPRQCRKSIHIHPSHVALTFTKRIATL